MAPISFLEAEIGSMFAGHRQVLIETQHFSSQPLWQKFVLRVKDPQPYLGELLPQRCSGQDPPSAGPFPSTESPSSQSPSPNPSPIHSSNFLFPPAQVPTERKFGKLLETPGCAFAQQRSRWDLCHAPRSHSSGTSQRTGKLISHKENKV